MKVYEKYAWVILLAVGLLWLVVGIVAVFQPGLRFTSWILYGVAIVHFAFFFMWPTIASGNAQLPDGQITVDATIFIIAAMFMIADAWNSYKSKV
jgi:hypothetical protein